jgi:hypothetical protein
MEQRIPGEMAEGTAVEWTTLPRRHWSKAQGSRPGFVEKASRRIGPGDVTTLSWLKVWDRTAPPRFSIVCLALVAARGMSLFPGVSVPEMQSRTPAIGTPAVEACGA